MKRFIEGDSRQQMALMPEALDDYIGEDNPSCSIFSAFKMTESRLEGPALTQSVGAVEIAC
jgi:hypothetical protein